MTPSLLILYSLAKHAIFMDLMNVISIESYVHYELLNLLDIFSAFWLNMNLNV